MKKNKLMLFSVVTLLSFSAMGTVNNINNMTAQAKATKVDKKHHKKHLSKHEKLLKEVRASVKHPKNEKKPNNTVSSDRIIDGYDETNQKIVDMNIFTDTASKIVIDKLNTARENNGLKPLNVDDNLTKLAKMRAQQSANQGYGHLSHYNEQGQAYSSIDAQQLNIMTYEEAEYSINENAGIYSLDEIGSTQELGNNAINDELIEGPTGGHYQNDMDSNVTKVGVAFYVKDNGNIGFNMEFQ